MQRLNHCNPAVTKCTLSQPAKLHVSVLQKSDWEKTNTKTELPVFIPMSQFSYHVGVWSWCYCMQCKKRRSASQLATDTKVIKPTSLTRQCTSCRRYDSWYAPAMHRGLVCYKDKAGVASSTARARNKHLNSLTHARQNMLTHGEPGLGAHSSYGRNPPNTHPHTQAHHTRVPARSTAPDTRSPGPHAN